MFGIWNARFGARDRTKGQGMAYNAGRVYVLGPVVGSGTSCYVQRSGTAIWTLRAAIDVSWGLRGSGLGSGEQIGIAN